MNHVYEHQKIKEYEKMHTDIMTGLLLNLSDALFEKDKYTYMHCHRVSLYCFLTGDRLKLETERMKSLLIGAFFHDIGKISIPNRILKKAGRLSPDEWKIIKTHSQASAGLLHALGFTEDTVSAILHHHERYDGTGYPNGLTNGSIPLFAKIISIADAYDAMTSERCYSGALKKEEALKEICLCKGSQFDPDVVDIFVYATQIPEKVCQAV